MNTIHKYVIDVKDKQTTEMRKDAEILMVGVQDGKICMWAIVDTKEDMENRTFMVKGTGHEIGYDVDDYVGTVQIEPYVWHVFESYD